MNKEKVWSADWKFYPNLSDSTVCPLFSITTSLIGRIWVIRVIRFWHRCCTMTVHESGFPNTTGSPGTIWNPKGRDSPLSSCLAWGARLKSFLSLSENHQDLTTLTRESCKIPGYILESCMRCPPHPACKDARYCDGTTWGNALCSRQYTELHSSGEASNEETWNGSCGMLAGNHRKSSHLDGEKYHSWISMNPVEPADLSGCCVFGASARFLA